MPQSQRIAENTVVVILAAGKTRNPGNDLLSGAVAAGYLFLAARALGYGTVFCRNSIPEPIARKKLTAERLAHAIRLATGDEAMRRSAATLGKRIRAEDGVGRAVAIIERTLNES